MSFVAEVASGKNLKGRPLLAEALADLDAGAAQVLVVTKVDRVGRSLLDVLRLAERAERNGWHLVILEAQVDTTTPQGRFVLQALGAVAELERGLVSQRTKAALAAKKAQGTRLGGPVRLPSAVRARIAHIDDGASRGAQRGRCSLAAEEGRFRIAIHQMGPVRLIDAAQIRQKPEAPFREAKQAVDLGQAERIVAVGRGIKSQENIALAERLAAAMHAEVAASRPICDNGWLPMERQVGSSGQTVAPKVYMALGISGAIQHLVGMKGSRTIVAINKDAEAPIFEVADYGIVGDLFEIVPALIAELEK